MQLARPCQGGARPLLGSHCGPAMQHPRIPYPAPFNTFDRHPLLSNSPGAQPSSPGSPDDTTLQSHYTTPATGCGSLATHGTWAVTYSSSSRERRVNVIACTHSNHFLPSSDQCCFYQEGAAPPGRPNPTHRQRGGLRPAAPWARQWGPTFPSPNSPCPQSFTSRPRPAPQQPRPPTQHTAQRPGTFTRLSTQHLGWIGSQLFFCNKFTG